MCQFFAVSQSSSLLLPARERERGKPHALQSLERAKVHHPPEYVSRNGEVVVS